LVGLAENLGVLGVGREAVVAAALVSWETVSLGHNPLARQVLAVSWSDRLALMRKEMRVDILLVVTSPLGMYDCLWGRVREDGGLIESALVPLLEVDCLIDACSLFGELFGSVVVDLVVVKIGYRMRNGNMCHGVGEARTWVV
jgi:hypothetical protein